MLAMAIRLVSAPILLAVVGGIAFAGPLATDPNAIPGVQGSSAFFGTNVSITHWVRADVEYAVYAPGMFGTSAALGFPGAVDPSGGTDYVYAYEIFNQPVVPPTPNPDMLGGELAGDEPLGGAGFSAIPAGSTRVGNYSFNPEFGVIPGLSRFVPLGDPKTQANWVFGNPTLGPGLHSDILFFTSPYAPRYITSSIIGGNATSASATLPTPIPEPATLSLALLGLLGLLLRAAMRRAQSGPVPRPQKASPGDLHFRVQHWCVAVPGAPSIPRRIALAPFVLDFGARIVPAHLRQS